MFYFYPVEFLKGEDHYSESCAEVTISKIKNNGLQRAWAIRYYQMSLSRIQEVIDTLVEGNMKAWIDEISTPYKYLCVNYPATAMPLMHTILRYLRDGYPTYLEWIRILVNLYNNASENQKPLFFEETKGAERWFCSWVHPSIWGPAIEKHADTFYARDPHSYLLNGLLFTWFGKNEPIGRKILSSIYSMLIDSLGSKLAPDTNNNNYYRICFGGIVYFYKGERISTAPPRSTNTVINFGDRMFDLGATYISKEAFDQLTWIFPEEK